MSDLLHHGHPDADQLSAFAEYALPEHERLETLAHLATCPDCRQVVFLAQQAREVQTPLPHSLPARTSWLTYWHNFWLLAAALTCGLLAFAVVHRRQSAELPKKSAVASMSSAPSSPVYTLPSTPVASVPQPSPKTPAPAKMSPAQHPAPAIAYSGVAETASTDGASFTNRVTNGATFNPDEFATGRQSSADPASASPHGSGGAFGGPIAAAPQAQQQKNSLLTAGQLQTVEVQSENQQLAPQANAPLARSEPTQSAANQSVSQTVTVNSAETLIQTENAVLSTSSFSGKASVTKNAKALLPSRKPTASTVSNGLETLAIDTEGDLFLSKDPGIAWQRITHQWTGKAVKVSLADPSSTIYAGGGASAGTSSSSFEVIKPASPAKKVGFELTTDTGTTWSSTDGFVWKHP